MSLIKSSENEKLTLDEDTKILIDNANKIRLDRDQLKNELLIDIIFDKLDKRVKNTYLATYNCTDTELKVYISESVKTLSDSIINTYSNEKDTIQFRNKYKYFLNNFKNQKRRWNTMALDNLKSNDISVQEYKKNNYNDLADNEFNVIFKKNITTWKSTKGLMIDFPLFPYITNGKSKQSAFTYDVGTIVYEVFSKYLTENLIYRQIDVLVNGFSPYTKKMPKYEVINAYTGDDKDILVGQTLFNNEEVEIQEQISILDNIDSSGDIDISHAETKRQLSYLLTNDLTLETQVSINNTINSNKVMFQPFDEFDLDIISYTLSQTDSNFYLDRKITVIEKDALIYLGKDPNQPKARAWLRKRYSKIAGKQIVVIEKNNTSKILYNKYVVFDKIVCDISGKKSLKSIEVFVGGEIYNNILREDTINVYKKDFTSIKNSKYPKAILLIFNLQLLRFSSYQMNKNIIQVSSSYFVNILKITSKNKMTTYTIIKDYLNQFIDNKVIVQSFEYDAQNQSWLLHFIELTTRDLTILMNSRKDYLSPARKFTDLLLE